MSWLSPTNLLWLFGHLVMFLLGVIIAGESVFANFLGRDVALAIGGALIAAGIAGEILFLYVYVSEGTRARLELFTVAGILKVFPHGSVRMREEYESRLKNAKEIDLIGFGLSSFRQDFASRFGKLASQAVIRIILLDPTFPSADRSLADVRDREEGNEIGEIRTDVEAFIRSVREAQNLDLKRFQVKLLRAIPAINLFRIDEVIFWGPYLINQQSRNMPTLIVQRGGFLFRQPTFWYVRLMSA